VILTNKKAKRSSSSSNKDAKDTNRKSPPGGTAKATPIPKVAADAPANNSLELNEDEEEGEVTSKLPVKSVEIDNDRLDDNDSGVRLSPRQL